MNKTLDSDILKSEWFSIISVEEDGKSENEEKKDYLYSLQKRVEECEQVNRSILVTLDEINKKLDECFKEDRDINSQLEEIKVKVRNNETSCNVIRNENLKLINRILEAEISVERTTNILLRKNISFPFTKINL